MNQSKLNEAYRRADLACAKVHYRLRAEKMYERAPLAPTEDNERDVLSRLAAARAQVEALDAPDAVFQIVKRHLIDFLDGEALEAKNYFSRPSAAISGLSFKVEHLAGIDSRPDEQKAEVLLHQLRALPEIAAAVKQKAQSADDAAREALNGECAYVQDNYRHYAENVGRYFPALAETEAAALSKDLLDACATLEALKTPGKAAAVPADDEDKRVPFTEEYYRRVLHDTLGVELDELLA